MMKTIILYQSYTEKVAFSIYEVLKDLKVEGEILKLEKKDIDINLYEYDFIFLGTPVIQFLPAEEIVSFIKNQLSKYRKKKLIIPCSPKIEGKYAICFCTYSGPHTGIREAVPAMKYMEQFFEHLRFSVLGEWYIIGEFKGNIELSTIGTWQGIFFCEFDEPRTREIYIKIMEG